MNDNLTDQLKDIYATGKKWLKLEIEYAKLTAVEKFTVFLTTLILGAVCMFLAMVVLILLSFALVDVFKSFMAPWASFLTVSGIWLLLIALVWVLRAPLLETPIARLISKLILDIKNEENEKE